MNWQRYNWSIIIISVLVTFAAASGGYYLWQQHTMTKPLILALKEIEGVEAVTLSSQEKAQTVLEIHVTLSNISNLQATYEKLNHTIKTNIEPKRYTLILHDHKTPALEEFYHSIHYQIFEGLATGNFSSMYNSIHEKAIAADIKENVYIDTNYLYLQLTTASGNLYQVIPRQLDNKEVR